MVSDLIQHAREHAELGLNPERINERIDALEEYLSKVSKVAKASSGGGGSSGGGSGTTLTKTVQNVSRDSNDRYSGYTYADGSWIIMRVQSDNVSKYATGGSGYATNWTNRTSLTYT